MNDILSTGGSLRDPLNGRSYALDCKRILVGPGISATACSLITSVMDARKILLVCDPSTHDALGQTLFDAISRQYQVELCCLPHNPKPERNLAEAIAQLASACDIIVAVGSGTINDLCKYASALSGKPYMVWATALSMNGYLSANASILENDVKKTLPARMPVAAFFDLDILTAAPVRLTRSGFGDAACRSTAQADWLLSHLLLATPYDETSFSLLKPYEPVLLTKAGGIAHGDKDVLHALTMTLILSGVGMTLAGGSYPASQGEHMIAHTMELMGFVGSNYHGEEIALTTLTMAKLQQNLLAGTPALRATDAIPLSYFGVKAAAFEKEYKLKCRRAELANLTSKLKAWGDIARQVQAVTVPHHILETALIAAVASVTPAALGWETEEYEKAVRHARYTRDRFTFLDLQA